MVLCVAGSSHAFTLHRVAAALDVSRIASTPPVAADFSAMDDLATMPETAVLNAPSTEIEVFIARECDADIQIVDEAGQRVCDARVHMPAGKQKLGFSGRDAQHRSLPNGIYYYSVIVGDDVNTTRVTIAR
jgi:hypothetical protein